MMEDSMMERYSSRAPRYTSYPTSPHFHAGIDAETYRQWLARLTPEDVGSLYFHIPFCQRLCWYCGCHTSVINRPQQVTDYVELLSREVDIVADALGFALRVNHIHWGGGTPTTVPAKHIRAFMEHLRRRFEVVDDAEIAIEIDPQTLDAETATALGESGFTRASLGVQDFTLKVQKAINRVQSLAETKYAADLLRNAGVGKINLDLMYGLPHQSADDVVRSIDLCLTLRPDRVALFGYAHVPWMKKHQKMIPSEALPGTRERMEQSECAARQLTKNGFRQIGLDHFALPDDPLCKALERHEMKRNFQGYTDDKADALLGFGASAIGTLPQGYIQNSVAMAQYRAAINAGRPAIERGIALAGEDRLRRDIIQTLMCEMRVDLAAMKSRHGCETLQFTAELEKLQPLVEDGLLECSGNTVQVTQAGRPFLRFVCAVFDEYLNSGQARHSRAL
jgi:oxygen-independent coproporphyrinogen-3 oxidase